MAPRFLHILIARDCEIAVCHYIANIPVQSRKGKLLKKFSVVKNWLCLLKVLSLLFSIFLDPLIEGIDLLNQRSF